jgi:hypothetical protein
MDSWEYSTNDPYTLAIGSISSLPPAVINSDIYVDRLVEALLTSWFVFV